MKYRWFLFFTAVLSVQSFAQSSGPSQSDQLKALQQELAERQQRLRRTEADASTLRDVLKRSELAIATSARALNNTQNELRHNRAEQQSLTSQSKALAKKIENQQSQLAAQVRSAYMAGNYDYAKMLLNQEDALVFERVLTYYQYFNRARQAAITEFKADIAELEIVNQRLLNAEQQLEVLLKNQQYQRAELQARQQDREQTLAKLNTTISTEADAITALRENEEALIRAIEEAEKDRQAALSEDMTLNGLSAIKGKLLAPAKGRLQRLFGKRRQGQVRWKGVVIESDEGTSVRAIHQGRVLYADWLKGFGLVSIIDHGEGYMSVYGHNQALLKQAGDSVKAGETIALVGQSGGQAYPNLYFEVRHKGKALNPTQWIKF